jgi:hypothetical protein
VRAAPTHEEVHDVHDHVFIRLPAGLPQALASRLELGEDCRSVLASAKQTQCQGSQGVHRLRPALHIYSSGGPTNKDLRRFIDDRIRTYVECRQLMCKAAPPCAKLLPGLPQTAWMTLPLCGRWIAFSQDSRPTRVRGKGRHDVDSRTDSQSPRAGTHFRMFNGVLPHDRTRVCIVAHLGLHSTVSGQPNRRFSPCN